MARAAPAPMFSRMGLQYNHFSRFLSESLSLCFIWWIFCEVLAILSSRCRFLTLKRESIPWIQQSQVPNGINKLWLSLPCKHGSREVSIIFCWLTLTSQSSLQHCRPDLLALLPPAGPQRCSETPGGGTVDRWASRPSGEVWVGVVEDDEVPLALWALFSAWSANGVKFKS